MTLKIMIAIITFALAFTYLIGPPSKDPVEAPAINRPQAVYHI